MKPISRDSTQGTRTESRGATTSPSPAAAAPNGDAGRPEFDELLRATAKESEELLSLREWVDVAEAWYITRALRQCRGNRSAAARALGIGRRTLYAKMEKLGIQPTWSANGVPGLQASEGAASEQPEPAMETRGASSATVGSPVLRVANAAHS